MYLFIIIIYLINLSQWTKSAFYRIRTIISKHSISNYFYFNILFGQVISVFINSKAMNIIKMNYLLDYFLMILKSIKITFCTTTKKMFWYKIC